MPALPVRSCPLPVRPVLPVPSPPRASNHALVPRARMFRSIEGVPQCHECAFPRASHSKRQDPLERVVHAETKPTVLFPNGRPRSGLRHLVDAIIDFVQVLCEAAKGASHGGHSDEGCTAHALPKRREPLRKGLARPRVDGQPQAARERAQVLQTKPAQGHRNRSALSTELARLADYPSTPQTNREHLFDCTIPDPSSDVRSTGCRDGPAAAAPTGPPCTDWRSKEIASVQPQPAVGSADACMPRVPNRPLGPHLFLQHNKDEKRP